MTTLTQNVRVYALARKAGRFDEACAVVSSSHREIRELPA